MNIRNEIESVIMSLMVGLQVTKEQIDEAVQKIMAIIGGIFVPVTAPESLRLIGIHTDDNSIELEWKSSAESAHCSHCGEISNHRSKTYYTRTIQDIPIQSNLYKES